MKNIDRIIQLLPALNDAQIAREVNITRERVRQIREKYRIKNPAFHAKCSILLNEDKLIKVIDLLKQGYNLKYIGKVFNIRKYSLGNILRINGINASDYPCIKNIKKFLEFKKAIKVYPNTHQISIALNLTPAHAYRWAKIIKKMDNI